VVDAVQVNGTPGEKGQGTSLRRCNRTGRQPSGRENGHAVERRERTDGQKLACGENGRAWRVFACSHSALERDARDYSQLADRVVSSSDVWTARNLWNQCSAGFRKYWRLSCIAREVLNRRHDAPPETWKRKSTT